MPITIHRLRCNSLNNPIGIDTPHPRLSWQIAANERGAVQTAYEIEVKSEGEKVWTTGKVVSSNTTHIPYRGNALVSTQPCTWRVRAWDGNDHRCNWSESATWEMGLLRPTDWKAQWVEVPWTEDPLTAKPAPYFRFPFTLEGDIASARLYSTAHGVYEAYINGERAGDEVLAPGYTSYHDNLQYQTYDVTTLLQQGENVIGVVVGDGWWRGSCGVEAVKNVYGDKLAVLDELRVTHSDGRETVIATGEGWTCATGPIVQSDLRDGETYDARRELTGWATIVFAQQWQPVVVVQHPKTNLVAPVAPPVRHKETFDPLAILTTPNGQTVVDFGQNLAGRVRMQVSGPAGTTITLTHGEVLDKDGNFTMANLNLQGVSPNLQQKVQYTLKGEGVEEYEPHFIFQGFRYVLVEAFPELVRPHNFCGIALYSDLETSGTFECSNPHLNQLQHNIEWSQKGNFLSIPTDGPQRERAGWTGDAQLYAPTGSYLMDTAGFYAQFLRDLASDQHRDGKVPNLIPDPYKHATAKGFSMVRATAGSAGWGDAAVLLPWAVYQAYGDPTILEAQYVSMKRWVDYMHTHAQVLPWYKRLNPRYWLDRHRREREAYLWDTQYHWGEWLEPSKEGAMNPALMMAGFAQRFLFSVPSVATAYFAYTTRVFADIAKQMGRTDDAQKYRAISERATAAYQEEYVSGDGKITPDTQASYVRALQFDLVPSHLREKAAQRLVALIRKNNNHLGTGFLSTPFLLPVLAESGHLDVAYDLLLQDTIPSWLYAVTKGATTIWETWEGISPAGEVQGSHNHYSYGAVGSFLYAYVAGIQATAPGYGKIRIAPNPGGGLTWAKSTYNSVHGTIASSWYLEDGQFVLDITIPANTTATIRLPNANLKTASIDSQPLERGAGIRAVRQASTALHMDVLSGTYHFSYPWT